MTETTGRCLCGAVRFAAPEAPKWTALCHCESCRRAASGAVVAWIGFEASDVRWTGERRFYASSPHARRGFCPTCGTQMSFESTRWPGELHLYATALDDPGRYRPQLHCHAAEQLPWLRLDDDLPRFPATAGETSEGAAP